MTASIQSQALRLSSVQKLKPQHPRAFAGLFCLKGAPNGDLQKHLSWRSHSIRATSRRRKAPQLIIFPPPQPQAATAAPAALVSAKPSL